MSWFDVEFHSMVVDLDTLTPLEHIEYGNDESEPPTDIDPHSNGH